MNDLSKLDLYAISVSNQLSDCLGVQFYDYDTSQKPIDFLKNRLILKIISEIFPFDCNLFHSTNGYHFVSFTVLNLKRTVNKANNLTNKLSGQDYSMTDYLVLRTSPKWRIPKEGHYSEKILETPAPYFLKQLSKPKPNTIISYKMLKLFIRYCKLPKSAVMPYNGLKQNDLNLKVYRYRAKAKLLSDFF